MHIGLIIYGSLDTVSGGYLYDRKLVDYLRQQGHTVEIISLPWRSYLAHLADNFSSQLLDRLIKKPFDILLQDELNHPSLTWLNGRLRSYINCPILSIVHHLRISEQHPKLWQPFYRLIEQHYLQSVDGFIFNSQTTKCVVQQLLDEERPFIVAPPAGNRFCPLDIEAINRKTAVSSPLRLLFVGGVTARKGISTLIEAVATLPKEAWHLDVVGCSYTDARYAHHWLKVRPKALAIDTNLTVHNSVSDDELAALYAQSHLLVVPSQYEGFGIVYLEAMGFGCPAIGTTSGAAHEIIVHGENGFLIEEGNTAVLAQHLHTFIKEPAYLQKMAHAARASFLNHATWQESMAAIEEFLRGFMLN